MITEKSYLKAKKIVDDYEISKAIMRPSFWFMTDNHTFIKLEGKNIEEVKEHAIQVAKENRYGMVCPVTILRDEKEVRRVGKACHVDFKGNVELDEWYAEIIKEDCVRLYDGT